MLRSAIKIVPSCVRRVYLPVPPEQSLQWKAVSWKRPFPTHDRGLCKQPSTTTALPNFCCHVLLQTPVRLVDSLGRERETIETSLSLFGQTGPCLLALDAFQMLSCSVLKSWGGLQGLICQSRGGEQVVAQ